MTRTAVLHSCQACRMVMSLNHNVSNNSGFECYSFLKRFNFFCRTKKQNDKELFLNGSCASTPPQAQDKITTPMDVNKKRITLQTFLILSSLEMIANTIVQATTTSPAIVGSKGNFKVLSREEVKIDFKTIKHDRV